MRRIIRSLSFLFLLGSALSHAESLVIRGGTIIDGTGNSPIPEGVIVIQQGRIVAVGDISTPMPPGARVISATGKYIIPGLMDANVHLISDTSIETLARYEGRYTDLIIEAAQVALKHGLTSVFDSWGPRQALVDARNLINQGDIPGSRIFLAGNIVGFGGPYTIDFSVKSAGSASEKFVERINGRWEQGVGAELLWMTPEQVATEVRRYVAKDIDFLKYGASGHSDVQEQFITFSPAVQEAIVTEGHRAGITVQSHTTSVESLRLAIAAGVDILQHCELTGPVPIPATTLDLIVARQIPCSTLSRTDKRQKLFSRLLYQSSDSNTRALIDAGAMLLLSTDSGVFGEDVRSFSGIRAIFDDPEDTLFELGEGHLNWMKAMDEKGMAPMDILLAATSNIAKAYKVDKDLGTLSVGKFADLVVLDANPLEDVSHYRRLHLVMKHGEVVDREVLPLKPVLTH